MLIAAFDADVAPSGDLDITDMHTGQQADPAALVGKLIDRLLKRVERPMRSLAISNKKGATAPLIAERTKARPTVDDFTGYFLPNQAPAD